MTDYKQMTECLACGSPHLSQYCNLGMQPLANNLKDTADQPDELYPLSVNLCLNCYHSQLSVAVDRDALYKHYLYVSGTSNTLVKEFNSVADYIHQNHPGEARNVLDIACNDGTFLRAFRKYDWNLWGIDPAENIVEKIHDKDINVISDYFPPTKDAVLPNFDVITCFNVLAHIPNPLEFLIECKKLLKRNGAIYIQTSQRDMIKNGEFDTVYHEHHSFFNINSMQHLAARAGLSLHTVESRPVHGRSYLFVLKHESDNRKWINELLMNEHHLLVPQTYSDFSNKVFKNKKRLEAVISHATAKGTKVVGYGAAAKGVVMSNHFGFKHDYIVDENPLKIGKVIGGVNIPVVHPDVLKNEVDNLVIIVYAWNFIDEITAKIKALRPNNEDIIVPSIVKE